MIVESSQDMQDVFRARFKKEGYRALVMRNPSLALQRFDGETGVADVVIFSCIGLGREGLERFQPIRKDGRHIPRPGHSLARQSPGEIGNSKPR